MNTRSKKISAILFGALIVGTFVLSSWHLAYTEATNSSKLLSDSVDTATAYIITSDSVEKDTASMVSLLALQTACDTTDDEKTSSVIAWLEHESDTTDSLTASQFYSAYALLGDTTDKDSSCTAKVYQLLALN